MIIATENRARMPIPVVQVTDKQVTEILTYVEGHFVDVKQKEIKPSKLSMSISAFANADGGELFIGIAEAGANSASPLNLPFPHRWQGFDDPEDANGHIQLFEKLFPLGEGFLYSFLAHPNHTGVVLHIVIQKSKDIVVANDGIPYVRRAAQKLPVSTPEALAILRRNKGITSYENEPVGTDLNTVCNSAAVIDFILNAIPTSEPEVWLRKQELIKNDKPTVAGVVLFADLPQAILPKRTGVKVYRYSTADEEGTRETLVSTPVTVEGCAYDLIKGSVVATEEIIKNVKVLGTKGLEQARYPRNTLHEVITNAVLHRDYSLADDVHVRIFDNRVEVESPGRLPAHITPQNVLKERFARNGNLVRVINKFPNPPNQDVGEGLNTAFEAMRQEHLKEPIIQELDHAVLIVIRHERMGTPEEVVMLFLENNEMITNREARKITGIKSENSMKEVFLRLRGRGKITPVPGRSGFKAAWQKC
jgi:ATP-dependent DNA helicase RecG